MTAVKVLTLLLASMAAVLAGTQAAQAAGGCQQCGCRTIKKVTRLVKTTRDIKVPAYRCSPTDTFHPDKSAVCHTGYRCETFYTPRVHWQGQECRIPKEVCEHVHHCVDKGHCECECTDEHHHKQFVDFNVNWTRRECVECKTVSGCKTLYGTTTNGCLKSTIVKEPTGEMCSRTAPVVRWVTYHVCDQCSHSWCDGDGELAKPGANVPSPQRADPNLEAPEGFTSVSTRTHRHGASAWLGRTE